MSIDEFFDYLADHEATEELAAQLEHELRARRRRAALEASAARPAA
jgi:hypothetical protein